MAEQQWEILPYPIKCIVLALVIGDNEQQSIGVSIDKMKQYSLVSKEFCQLCHSNDTWREIWLNMKYLGSIDTSQMYYGIFQSKNWKKKISVCWRSYVIAEGYQSSKLMNANTTAVLFKGIIFYTVNYLMTYKDNYLRFYYRSFDKRSCLLQMNITTPEEIENYRFFEISEGLLMRDWDNDYLLKDGILVSIPSNVDNNIGYFGRYIADEHRFWNHSRNLKIEWQRDPGFAVINTGTSTDVIRTDDCQVLFDSRREKIIRVTGKAYRYSIDKLGYFKGGEIIDLISGRTLVHDKNILGISLKNDMSGYVLWYK